MGTREELLRRRICRGVGCGAVFWICCHCDRGHRYCSDRCRRVTDHTSATPSGSDSIVTAELFRSEDELESDSGEDRYAESAEFEPACIICGCTLGSAPAKRPSFPDGG